MTTTIFVGDIHGRLAALQRFLLAAGCVEQESGSWQLPENTQLVFVGDLIDTGSEGRQVVALVRQLLEQGDARCIMGNHEFNFAQYHTPHPQHGGDFLRPHSAKNTGQVQATLDSYQGFDEQLADDVEWMRSLPIAIFEQQYRCVHACWHEPSLRLMTPHSDGSVYIPEEHWANAADETSPYFAAVEMLCKGPEMLMPNGASYQDSYGNQRVMARVAWWQDDAKTWGEALRLPVVEVDGLDLDAVVTASDLPRYPADYPPVFFGHYWFNSEIGNRQPVAANAACVDFSCARTEQLVGYRFVADGKPLEAKNFIEDGVMGNHQALVVFSHGKESGPWGSKIKHLAEVAESLGFGVTSIDYTSTLDPDQRVIMLNDFLSTLERPYILVGSSMGGYASLVAAQSNNPAGLFLLAPALYMDGYAEQDYLPQCDTIEIVHGSSDEVVPYQNSIRFAESHKCNLHLIGGDHRLNSSLSVIEKLFHAFLERV